MNYEIKQALIKTNNRKLSWTDVILLCIILATSNNLQNIFLCEYKFFYLYINVFSIFLMAYLTVVLNFFDLVWFYGPSTIVGYLMVNPLYTYLLNI